METQVVVIGAGHAGCEAALACARMGLDTLLLTLNVDSVGLMPCNPAIGGTGKGQLVRELDALGGEMGLCIDKTFLQSRMLNRGKGPAVYSLRAQADKRAYHDEMLRTLCRAERLTLRQGECSRILTQGGRVSGVLTATGETIPCRGVIVCGGVYLKSRIIIGPYSKLSGPQGLLRSETLSDSLAELGFPLRRFKTGTPARIDERSIDFDKMEKQEGDTPIVPFSFLTDAKGLKNRACCYLTYTSAETHRIILDNIHLSPMYSGDIKGTGARYCPSIEDKVKRFADKERHPIFLEPEGAETPEWYAQGMSSSLPEHVQWAMYRSVRGLERAVLTRLAYAIEYDCIDPTQLTRHFRARHIEGLYFAGQVNGTSGYEEAAAQGLYAGINCACALLGREGLTLTRENSYLGVLVDDLTQKGTDEPYRMMTSRAEHRLLLRQDNADLRLTAMSHALGLASDERMRRMEKKRQDSEELQALLQAARVPQAPARDEWLRSLGEEPPTGAAGAAELLRRPRIDLDALLPFVPQAADYSAESREQAELNLKYAGYLEKERQQIARAESMARWVLPDDLDYLSIEGLRIEARQKLQRQRPADLSGASRIPGVSPADIAVLMVLLKRKTEEEKRHGTVG